MLLEVEDVHVDLPARRRAGRPSVPVLRGVNLAVDNGESVGLVGESGSGKSMTARAIVRLLPNRAQTTGSLRFNGVDVLAMNARDLRTYRARDVAMIFQDPRVAINPIRTIGDFLTEALRTHCDAGAADAAARQALNDVRINDASRRLRQYPHELSGGMLQRVMIAAALLGKPRLLLADEPTTALDVTTQAEIMVILQELRADRGMAVLFISHDLELAAAVCTRTAVMYAGEVVETQPSAALHTSAHHPYTRALLGSRPTVGRKVARLTAIPGAPSTPGGADDGCQFAPRCPHAQDRCRAIRPVLEPSSDVGRVACLRWREIPALQSSSPR